MDKELNQVLGEGLEWEPCAPYSQAVPSEIEEEAYKAEALYERYAKEENYKDLLRDCEEWYAALETSNE